MRTKYGVKIRIGFGSIYSEPIYSDFDECPECGEELDGTPTFENQQELCESCLKKKYRVEGDTEPCSKCGETDWNDCRYEYDGAVYCSDCLRKIFFR